jgi:hypothetical protein
MSAHEIDETGACITCSQADRMYFRAASGGRVPEQTARATAGRGSRGGAGTNLAGSVAPGDPTLRRSERGPLPAESVFEPDLGARGIAVLLLLGLGVAAAMAIYLALLVGAHL